MAELMQWLREANPILQALVAGMFTLGITSVGAALVLVWRDMPQAWLDAMLGFAAGVMMAASFWSLLAPAIDLAEQQGGVGWMPAAIGFLLGAGFLQVADRYLPHLHPSLPLERAEGLRTRWRQSTLLILAITLHNIPEGLAVGVAFGAIAAGVEASFGAALALAIGIGLQNFPEGVAVAMPLRRAGASPGRCFLAGTLSAAVEPVAAVVGAAAVSLIRPLLPYALSFAAGAMIYVVVEELIPESQQGGRTDLAAGATIVGFTLMMVLDVALG